MDDTPAAVPADTHHDSLSTPGRRAWKMVRKLGALMIGVPVVLLGIVLLAAPGPGTLVIIAGLAILATEFPWAHRQMNRLKAGARSVVSRPQRTDEDRDPADRDATDGASHS